MECDLWQGFPLSGTQFIHQLNGRLDQIVAKRDLPALTWRTPETLTALEKLPTQGPSSFVLQSVKFWAEEAGP